jgi:hypothetical protein
VRRQRVLNGKTPDQIIAECLEARPQLSKPKGTSQGRAGPCDITKARFIAQAAKEVSQSGTGTAAHSSTSVAAASSIERRCRATSSHSWCSAGCATG